MAKKSAISPKRDEDYPNWYQQVIKAADLAEHSPVRGCMVIKPWGYAIWENIQKILDKEFKKLGVKNAYFPLFIPLSFMEKEAEHVKGFAKECAVVTHHRLEATDDGKLIPQGKLDEPLIVRPTSEMIIGQMFSKWVESYKNLPIKINQWANIVRWEMRTRLFLRTTEFLWQEGHTAFANEKEAIDDATKMVEVYRKFYEEVLAIPVLVGKKTEREKFPGAVDTFCVEAMMQDKKALQGGTSHYLGQNFAKSCDIKFNDASGEEKFAYTSSWGVTTRMIGALIMAHSDDDGFIIPPKLAETHVVILPIVHDEEKREKIEKFSKDLKILLEEDEKIGVEVDFRDLRGGEKKWSWVKKGVPIILEIGAREIENDKFAIIRRDDFYNKSCVDSKNLLKEKIEKLLIDIQENLFNKAKKFRNDNLKSFTDREKFKKYFTPKNINKPEIHGGFAKVYFSLDEKIEESLQKDLGITVRCVLDTETNGKCIFTGKDTDRQVVFAKAY